MPLPCPRMSLDVLLTWQLIDSAFPAGGMSHSAGLEATWQAGEIASTDDVAAFAQVSVSQHGCAMTPFVVAGYEASTAKSEIAFEDVDARCDAFLTNHVTNRASRAQGRAMLSAVRRSIGGESVIALERVARDLPCHLAPVTGAVGAVVGLPNASVVRWFLFASSRAVMSAAVRMGRVGPFEAQAIQYGLRGHIERVAATCETLPIDDACATAPLADVAAAMQDRLYSRLFVS
jgi:urease accessory protein